MSEINNKPAEAQEQDNQEEEREYRPGTQPADPPGEVEQPIGMWWNPEPWEQNVEHGIGNSH